MRHRKKVAKLGREAPHRKALLRNLATDLLRHERVTHECLSPLPALLGRRTTSVWYWSAGRTAP